MKKFLFMLALVIMAFTSGFAQERQRTDPNNQDHRQDQNRSARHTTRHHRHKRHYHHQTNDDQRNH
jgi:hypothetical protein